MNDPLISVIVPIYKVEEYLDRCITSIVNQTYKNLEIILIDDGSPDQCPQKCDEWKEKDDRIIIVHSENNGAGSARNIGLKIAKGNYISFVDSDDVLRLDFIEYLYHLFDEETDIVECEYVNFSDTISFPKPNSIEEVKKFSMSEAMKYHINDICFKQVIWNKLYRKKVVENINFPVDKKIDDEFWTYKVIFNSKNLIHSTKVGYAYRQQDKSVMHLLSNERRIQGIEAKIERHNFIKNNIPNLTESSLINLWFTCIYQCQLLLKNKNNNYNKALIIKIKEKIIRYKIVDICSLETPFKNKIWLSMASLFFVNTCRLRNYLRIGVK